MCLQTTGQSERRVGCTGLSDDYLYLDNVEFGLNGSSPLGTLAYSVHAFATHTHTHIHICTHTHTHAVVVWRKVRPSVSPLSVAPRLVILQASLPERSQREAKLDSA